LQGFRYHNFVLSQSSLSPASITDLRQLKRIKFTLRRAVSQH
jgi:hypothetical protein